MTSAITYHNLAIHTMGNFDSAVAHLRDIITVTEDAKPVVFTGIALTATFMREAAPPGVKILMATRAKLPSPHEHLTDVAHWITRAMQQAVNTDDQEFADVEITVDAYILTHDVDDCINVAAGILIHYFSMVVAHQDVMLGFGPKFRGP